MDIIIGLYTYYRASRTGSGTVATAKVGAWGYVGTVTEKGVPIRSRTMLTV